MSAAAGGDMDAFEELVRRHQHGAINVAWRLLSNEHQAQDAAQEAFVRLLESAPRYRPTARFRTYLYRIVTHICIDEYRKRRPDSAEDLSGHHSDDDSPSEAMMRSERVERIREAIAALPERQRAALVLQHYEGLSYGEIAEALQCSPRAVDSLLVRAREKLVEGLGDLL
jgi:RNA polymerase sigma-70 factor (ECF subfamily)